MKTSLTEMFGIEAPIFAFSHCRDVVVAASKAGGFGVLGAAWTTPEHLDQELRWIEQHIDGMPFGVDLVFSPTAVDLGPEKDPVKLLPPEHVAYINGLMTRDGVPELPPGEFESWYRNYSESLAFTPKESEELLDVALRYDIKFVVSALGIPPAGIIERVHQAGLPVGALVGTAEQARKQVAAGIDVIIAQGSEAGGHTGTVGSMVLWPEVVDAVAPVPVLAAGGIGRGRQMAAALALGAQGVWCGSIWLGTTESELNPDLRDVLYGSGSTDAVITRGYTGKPCRVLRSKFTEAWAAPEAPAPLKVPYQSILSGGPFRRAERAHRKDWMTYSAGQVVGQMTGPTSVRQVVYDMLSEYADAMESLDAILSD